MEEEILNELRKKLGERIDYFELPKILKAEEIAALQKLIENGEYEVKQDEAGKVWVVKVGSGEQKASESEIKELRKDIIKQTIEKLVEKKEMSLSEIATIIVSYLATKIKPEEKREIAKRIWFSLPFKNIKTYYVADEQFYEFELEGKKFKVAGNEILAQAKIRNLIFQEFGILLPRLSPEHYTLFLMWFKSVAEEVTKLKETENMEENVRETIINYINNSFVTKNIEETFSYNYIYLDGDGVFVPSEIIAKILASNNYRITPQRLAFILKDLILIPSKTIRVKGMGVKRFWVFDKSCFEIKETVGEENENSNSGQARDGQNGKTAQKNN